MISRSLILARRFASRTLSPSGGKAVPFRPYLKASGSAPRRCYQRRNFSENVNSQNTTSAEESAASVARARRRAAAANRAQAKPSYGLYIAGGVILFGAFGATAWYFSADPTAKEAALAVPQEIGNWIETKTEEALKPLTNPVRDELLPDWPPFPNIPPNVPCPPTLVLDLEDTLVHSEWDRKYGWRHAKRPGVDKFLAEMAQYYEIVIFTSNPMVTSENVISLLDKEGYVMHRLYRECTTLRKGVHIKDLSRMNRDIRKIVIIDDDPRSYQLQPENAVPIKPYLDGHDRSDTALVDLIPFLKALAREGVEDFRDVLKDYAGKDIAEEYNRKLRMLQERREKNKGTGLRGIARKSFLQRGAVPGPPEGGERPPAQ